MSQTPTPKLRNSSGRFLSKSNSNRRRNSINRNTASIKVLQVTSPRQLRAAERLLTAGAGSLVLIWSPTCPHCHTYMPLWEEMTKMPNKAKNMISIRSDIYTDSFLADVKPVNGVPTVLHVDSEGKIQEVEEARNKSVMTTLVTTPEASANKAKSNATGTGQVNMNASVNRGSAMEDLESKVSIPVTVPGTQTMPSELAALPGYKGPSTISEEEIPEQPVGSQRGGNFGSLVRAAGPAALLLGAYAAFGRTRSSGLPPVRHSRTRRVRFSRRKRSSRRR